MAWMMGLDSHMTFTRANPKTKGEWYTHCYDLLSSEARYFVCKTALACHTSDGLHKLLLKDDRVGRCPGQYVSKVQEGLDYLNTGLPQMLFDRLAIVIPEVGAIQLEHGVLRAAYQCVSYLDRRLLSVARKEIWQIVSGDIRAKLADLARADAPCAI